jgi:hypothetical protein
MAPKKAQNNFVPIIGQMRAYNVSAKDGYTLNAGGRGMD